ncbi:MAG: HAD family hydrolase [Bacteroidales bacterium]|nr:HAD family hydrolase [Bacteroidales bacterium]
MRNDSKEYIKNLLDNIGPLKPIPTGLKTRFQNNGEIKAVLFDIYGTLLISSSGDIDQAEITMTNLKQALEASRISIINNTDTTLDHILKDFEYTIRVCHEAAKQNKVPYPEIDVLSIWKIVLIHARRKGLIEFNDDADIMLMTCVFEFLSNKVYPMPNMRETIKFLHNKSMPLGIISNAQFYTPVLMNYFLNDNLTLKEKIKGFDKELTVLSYKFGKGKPDLSLFNDVVTSLKWKYGIIPSETLFVGNDMLKDIYTSKQVGFQTVLFAGDKRSLRLRKDEKLTAKLEPDYIINDLAQLKEIV